MSRIISTPAEQKGAWARKPKLVKPMPRQSAKQRAKLAEWAKTTTPGEYVKCARCGRSCHKSLIHKHHKKPRARSSDNSAANKVDLCPKCHRHIEENRIEAVREGFLISAKVSAQIEMESRRLK